MGHQTEGDPRRPTPTCLGNHYHHRSVTCRVVKYHVISVCIVKLTWTKYFHKKIVKGETLYHFFHLYIIFFISPFIDASILTFYSKGQGYIYYYLYYRCRQ